jgi:hypothetical protein
VATHDASLVQASRRRCNALRINVNDARYQRNQRQAIRSLQELHNDGGLRHRIYSLVAHDDESLFFIGV